MLEIERKYLLKRLPNASTLGTGEWINQAYLATGEPEIRVRKRGTKYFLTLKRGTGLKRSEHETEIPKPLFEKLSTWATGNVVEKRRYSVNHNNHVWEIDEYEGHLKRLLTAEVELESSDESVDIPPFLVVAKEITHDDAYKNKNLAVHGLPKSFREDLG